MHVVRQLCAPVMVVKLLIIVAISKDTRLTEETGNLRQMLPAETDYLIWSNHVVALIAY